MPSPRLAAASREAKEIPRSPTDSVGLIAQLVERLICNEEVTGSNPVGSTNRPLTLLVLRTVRSTMRRMDISLNIWAVVGAAVAYVALGALWYGPLFGKKWRMLAGISEADMSRMPLTPWQAMGMGLVSAGIMAYVLGAFMQVWGAFSSGDIVRLVFWIWIGFIAVVHLGSFLWEGKPLKLFVLNASYSFFALWLMACILGRWA